MKLRILLLLSIFISYFLNAQEEQPNQFGVEVFGMVDLFTPSSTIGLIRADDSYLAGASFNLSKKLQEKIDLNYGAGIRIVSYKEIDYSITFGEDHDRDGGVDPLKSWTETSGLFNFISGNAGIKLKSSTSRKHLYIKPALEAWYYITTAFQKQRIQESGLGFKDGGTPNLNSPNKFFFFGSASVGYQFPMNSLDFFVEVRGSYTFQKLFLDEAGSDFEITPFGIVLGCQF